MTNIIFRKAAGDSTVKSLLCAFLCLTLSHCTTRVGNPKRPTNEATLFPSLGDLIPQDADTPPTVSSGSFDGATDLLSSFAGATRHRSLFEGVNTLAAQVTTWNLQLDKPYEEQIGEHKVRAHLKAGSDGAGKDRILVICRDNAPIFEVTWTEGAPDLRGTFNVETDPLESFAAVHPDDRRQKFTIASALDADSGETRVTLEISAAPKSIDPFVDAAFTSLFESAAYSASGDRDVFFQSNQTWHESESPPGSMPQVVGAGAIEPSGATRLALHHADAVLVCPDPFDRNSPDTPGWCASYESDPERNEGQFGSAARAQAIWTEVKAIGILDPAAQSAPDFQHASFCAMESQETE